MGKEVDCLVIECGIQNNRINLTTIKLNQLDINNKKKLVKGIATNVTLAYCLGLW